MREVTGEVDVVNPDLRGVLNANSVTSISQNLGDLEVTDDDVRCVENAETDTVESY